MEEEQSLRDELRALLRKKQTLGDSIRRISHDSPRTLTTNSFRDERGRNSKQGTYRVNVTHERKMMDRHMNSRLGKRGDRTSNLDGEKTSKRIRLHSAVTAPVDKSGDNSENSQKLPQEPKKSVTAYGQKEVVARSRRMFGALMGHLGKAKQRIERDTDLFQKQDAMVQKVDEKEKNQSKQLEIKAKLDGSIAKHEKLIAQTEIEKAENIATLKLHHLEEVRRIKTLSSFLVTTSSPPIYYLPPKLTQEMVDLLSSSEEAVSVKIQALQRKVEVDLANIEVEYSTKLEKYQSDFQELKNQKANTKDPDIEDDNSENDASVTSAGNIDTKKISDDDSDGKNEISIDNMESQSKSSPKDIDEPSVNNEDSGNSMKKLSNEDTIPVTPENRSIVPENMKVTELREELKKRGLDTKGLKANLIKRLEDALDDSSDN